MLHLVLLQTAFFCSEKVHLAAPFFPVDKWHCCVCFDMVETVLVTALAQQDKPFLYTKA